MAKSTKAAKGIVFPPDGVLSLDRRITQVRDYKLPCAFRRPPTRDFWEARRRYVCQRVLTAAGLSPMPPRDELDPYISEAIRREGYLMHTVWFESLPGLLCTGTLYRPRREAVRPGVLCPHGHWSFQAKDGSADLQRRCANLALLGFTVFWVDMLGYRDSQQFAHRDTWDRAHELWGITPMGIQLWHMIRSVDFLQSLPDVDGEQIGCTGASGGATQTYFLTAVDERVTVSAPVCMVSAHMQGGCVCENGPVLRLDLTNVEIAACTAPRPMVMVSATGDWSNANAHVEAPDVQSVYRLYDAEERFRHVQFDAPHNYNRDSREVVYAWLVRHLLGRPDTPDRLPEREVEPEPLESLRVWPDGQMPKRWKTGDALAERLQRQIAARLPDVPRTRSGLRKFGEQYAGAYRLTLSAAVPPVSDQVVRPFSSRDLGEYAIEKYTFQRRSAADQINVVICRRRDVKQRRGRGVVIADPDTVQELSGLREERVSPLVEKIAAEGLPVVAFEPFLTAYAENYLPLWHLFHTMPHMTTYNRTIAAERVQDVLTVTGIARDYFGMTKVALVGLGGFGVNVLMAAPLADEIEAVAADLTDFDPDNDADWLEKCYVPLIRGLGGLRVPLALLAGRRLRVAGLTGKTARWARGVYEARGRSDALTISSKLPKADALARWLAEK